MRPFVLAAVTTLLLMPSPPAQSAELRAVWIARDGLGSRARISATLDALAAANVNCVCVNVWSRGYTIHPSDVLARACGVRQDPSYVGRDPLQETLVEAHRRGIEVEAWFEYGFMFGWSGWFAGPSGVGPVLTANPGWIGMDAAGTTQVGDGAGGFHTWASHEHPEVRRFLLDLAVETVDRYDVDGIQFDRVRYPSTAWGYDPTTVAAYRAATGQSPPSNANQSAWKRWRADRLSAFHHDLRQAIAQRRGTVRVTDAPTVMPGAYDTYLQDWPAWLAAGSLDLVYPQVYRTTASSYVTTLDQQLAYVSTPLRAKVAPGIRAISGTPTAEVLAMVAANRARNLPGHVFWYAEGLSDDLGALLAGPFANHATIPGRPVGWRALPIAREENDPTTAIAGAWSAASSANASGGAFRIAAPGSAPSDSVTFTLMPGEAGLWRVLANQLYASLRSSAVEHAVTHAAGTELVHVDQGNATNAGWVQLGEYWLDPARGPCTVRVARSGLGEVAADAVALLRSRNTSGAMTRYGAGTHGARGIPELSASGRAALGGTFALQLHATSPSSVTLLAIGFQSAALPLAGGLLLVAPAVVVGGTSDARGIASAALTVPFDQNLHGLPIRAQGLVVDASAVDGLSLSAAVALAVY